MTTPPRLLIWRSGSATATAWQTGKVRWVNSGALLGGGGGVTYVPRLTFKTCRFAYWRGNYVAVGMFYYYICAFVAVTVSTHLCVVCRHFYCPMSLFQGHIACWNFTLTGPLIGIPQMSANVIHNPRMISAHWNLDVLKIMMTASVSKFTP